MAPFNFRGIVVAALSTFNKDLSINTDIIPKYAKFLADTDATMAVLVNGTNGEGMSMSAQERKTVAEVWVAEGKKNGQHIMVQVGGCPLPDVKDLARHAEKIGADSLLCLPELYFKPKTALELIDYLKHVSDAAPNTPLLYYHSPAVTGVNVNMTEFVKLSVGKIPTLTGIKYTSPDLEEAYKLLKAAEGHYTIFYATRTLIEPVAAQGYDSFMAATSNLFHKNLMQIIKAVDANNLKEARALQDKLVESEKLSSKNGQWIGSLKAAMKIFHGLDLGEARPPFLNLTEAEQNEMKEKLKNYVV